MLSNKVILVTGGASGIGLATCEHLLLSGARVVLWDIDAIEVGAAVKNLDASGQRCHGFTVDVTNAKQVETAMVDTLAAFGALHGAFNNAGIGAATRPLADMSEADFDAVLAVDLKGVWLCMKHELLHFREHGGVIVNNASVAGLVALAGQSAYVASKHGVIGLTKTAAVEYAAVGVRINAVCPGAVRTPILEHLAQAGIDETALAGMAPMGRIGNPDEIAKAVAWLLSAESSFVTGAAMPIDGGWTAQ
jgi:NAD(P)-dependent dehydrogenase (short-subunit alcohol dehydrogenase family)